MNRLISNPKTVQGALRSGGLFGVCTESGRSESCTFNFLGLTVTNARARMTLFTRPNQSVRA
jgi:hypothetical protein